MHRHFFFSRSFRTQQGKVSLWISLPLGLLALLVILYLLFANTLLKNMAQRALGEASGAEVNIDGVSHNLFPFGLTLTRLQATDNGNPMRNKLEVAKISADVDLMPLLNKKLIVNELTVQDVEFDTKRTGAGEVYVQPDGQASSFSFPNLEDLPSVDEILEKSPLKTTAAVVEAQQVLAQYKEPIKQKYAALPNKDKLKSYKERLKALKDADYKNPVALAAAKKEFDEIKEAIAKDKENITRFIELAKEAKAASSSSVDALKSAPQEDYALLKGLVAGDEGAIGQVTQHLFGEKAKMYTKALLVAMDMMSNTEEAEVEAPKEDDGLPNVWIKKAAVNIKWQDEQIQTAWQNITDQHAIVGNPTTFLIDSSKANNWNNINLKGSFEIIEGKFNAAQDWDIKGLVLDTVELVPEESKQKLNALLESGLLASKGGLKIVDGKLSGSSVFDLSSLKLQASGKNDLTSAMAEVISGLSELKLNTDFSGSLSRPSIKVQSDLDKKMLQALSSGLTSSTSGKLGELKSKLNAKVAEQLGQSSQELESVDALLSAAQGDTDSLNELLKSQMTNALDKKKDELLNKIGDKLFNN
jgi:uncharacterized protein (TIGR03545 family)